MLRSLFLSLSRFVLLGKTSGFLFTNNNVSFPSELSNIGLYLHIPFCRQICPFCPYNKTLFNEKLAMPYESALIKEINLYKKIIGDTFLPSLYIGGGTPTTMVGSLLNIIDYLRKNLNLGDEIGLEIHPNDVNSRTLRKLKDVGVNMMSLGIQSFNDKYLRMIGRNYDGETAETSLREVLGNNFKAVDVDILFSLPTQTVSDVMADISKAFGLGVDQISCYPLIAFSYSQMPRILRQKNMKVPSLFQEKKMLDGIINLAEKFGYERTSIWTFTKKGSSRYTSVTREFFVGLGTGAASYIPGFFYINTFSIEGYIKTTKKKLPIALAAKLTEKEQMAWWLFWRFYDTCLSKDRFRELFHLDIHQAFGLIFRILVLLRMVQENQKTIRFTNLGAFLFHLIEQQYSLSYLNTTWGSLSKEPWPEKLEL